MCMIVCQNCIFIQVLVQLVVLVALEALELQEELEVLEAQDLLVELEAQEVFKLFYRARKTEGFISKNEFVIC